MVLTELPDKKIETVYNAMNKLLCWVSDVHIHGITTEYDVRKSS